MKYFHILVVTILSVFYVMPIKKLIILQKALLSGTDRKRQVCGRLEMKCVPVEDSEFLYCTQWLTLNSSKGSTPLFMITLLRLTHMDKVNGIKSWRNLRKDRKYTKELHFQCVREPWNISQFCGERSLAIKPRQGGLTGTEKTKERMIMQYGWSLFLWQYSTNKL